MHDTQAIDGQIDEYLAVLKEQIETLRAISQDQGNSASVREKAANNLSRLLLAEVSRLRRQSNRLQNTDNFELLFGQKATQ